MLFRSENRAQAGANRSGDRSRFGSGQHQLRQLPERHAGLHHHRLLHLPARQTHPFIIFKNVLPNIFGQIIIMAMFSIPNAIFYEAFLAMVGLGIPAPQASLGSLINDGFKTILVTPYQVIIPVVILGILMLSFNLLADGLRDAFDPKMKEM